MPPKICTLLKRVFILASLALFIYFIFYNVSTQKLKFWEASFVDCITILIAVVISYYLVQKQNNYQKQKDIVLDMILKMQVVIEQKAIYDFSGQDKDAITMRTRDLNNRIHILETIKCDFKISKEVDFIRKHFDEYSTLIGDHISDINYLLQSQKELKRPVELIDQKLLEAALHLYR